MAEKKVKKNPGTPRKRRKLAGKSIGLEARELLITAAPDESPLDMLDRGEVPPLKSLRLHNGTVYRWNRPCYGINDNGKAHLRIECRVLPAGPTVKDEVATRDIRCAGAPCRCR